MNVPYNVEFIANRRGDSQIARLTKFFSYGLGNISICKLIASGQWQPTTQCSYAILHKSKIEQKFRVLHFVGLLPATTQDEIKDFCASVKL